MTIDVRWGSASHAGRVRRTNQDSVLAGPVVFVVADGMGGHAAGEVASSIAVAQMSKLGAERPLGVAEVIRGVEEAHSEIRRTAAGDPARSAMGTTVAGLALLTDDPVGKVLVFNVGDSRVYRYHAESLEQLTLDHSLVGEMVRAGELTREAARIHPARNVVTRALGVDETPVVDHWLVPPLSGDRYIICSDGLSNELSDEELAAATQAVAGLPQMAADALLGVALQRGAQDNVSVIVVEIVGVRDRPEEEDDDTSPNDSIEELLTSVVEQVETSMRDEPAADPEMITGVPTFFDGSLDVDATPGPVTI